MNYMVGKKLLSCLALGFSVLVAGCDQIKDISGAVGGASSNEIVAGDKRVKIVDQLIVLDNKFEDSNDIEISFFAIKLTPEQKKALAAEKYLNNDGIKRITGGSLPVMKIIMPIEDNAPVCDQRAVRGYTVIFAKNPEFDFDVIDNVPLNFAFSGGAASGFANLKCASKHGDNVSFTLSNNAVAKGDNYGDILSPGVSELNFEWNINISEPLMDPKFLSQQMQPENKTEISNNDVLTAVMAWDNAQSKLIVRAFNRVFEKRDRDAAAIYKPAFRNEDVVILFEIKYKGTPADFSVIPERVVMEVPKKQGGGYIGEVYVVDPSAVHISGRPEMDSRVIFKTQGVVARDAEGIEPGMYLNLNFSGRLTPMR